MELNGATADINNVRAELVAVLEANSWACDHVDTFTTTPTNLLLAIDCDYLVKAFAKGGGLYDVIASLLLTSVTPSGTYRRTGLT